MPHSNRTLLSSYLALLAIAVMAASIPPASRAQAQPEPKLMVEAQPLLAQAGRVREALAYLGAPLSVDQAETLARAGRAGMGAQAVALVQAALDPLCLAELRLSPEGLLTARPGPARPVLHEQGWTTYLVKVHNPGGSTGTLRVTSPNAGQVPNGPADQVESRWLDLSLFDGRPLNPTLSGLELEYRILQVYARDPGSRRAPLVFNVGEPPSAEGVARPSLIREWRFPRDAAAWKAMNQCRLEVKTDALRVVSTGVDPYLGAEVTAPGGRMVLRFRARAERPGFGQFFWWTADQPRADGSRLRTFSLNGDADRFRDYSVSFETQGELRGVRLDPTGAPGWVDLEEISLYYEDAPGRYSATLRVPFDCRPSQPVTLRIRDERGKPATATFVIRDELGRVYPSQSKRLAPDFFFHSQIYRHDGESVRLPAGKYTVRCSRGPESIPEVRQLTVADRALDLHYRVQRWIDPARSGWYSGDHHIHAAGCAHYTSPTEGVRPEDMARHIMGEDLKVGANLTWGPGFDHQKQFFTAAVDKVSRYPYLLRYDIEVSGFGSHQSGHLCLLRLKEQIYPGGASKEHWPTLGLNTLRWAKRQGAVCGPAHSALGLGGEAGRVEGPDGPEGLPNYTVPRFDGIGANEFIVDVTHEVPGPSGKPVPAVDFISTMNTDRKAELNIWYHVLNCGFRTRISGETDFPCITGERVGLGRVYVQQRGRLTYNDWCEGIREGRSYVSDGYHHLTDFRAELTGRSRKSVRLGMNGSQLQTSGPATVRVRVRAAARREGAGEAPVELVVNGYPVARQQLTCDGKPRDLVFDVPIRESGWLAVRIYPNAHTNPIWVEVGGKPVRPSRRSAEWCLRGVDQCWSQKQRTYAPAEMEDARQAYDHARARYREILNESRRTALTAPDSE